MAGNRLQRSGSIFQRLTGILKAGAIKEQDIPLWYDVYKAFPPKYDPAYAVPPVEKEIPSIFYAEDVIRGKFLQSYSSVNLHDLLRSNTKSIMQRFVEKYQELEKSGNFSNDKDLFKATESELDKEGITFVRNKKILDSADDKLNET